MAVDNTMGHSIIPHMSKRPTTNPADNLGANGVIDELRMPNFSPMNPTELASIVTKAQQRASDLAREQNLTVNTSYVPAPAGVSDDPYAMDFVITYVDSSGKRSEQLLYQFEDGRLASVISLAIGLRQVVLYDDDEQMVRVMIVPTDFVDEENEERRFLMAIANAGSRGINEDELFLSVDRIRDDEFAQKGFLVDYNLDGNVIRTVGNKEVVVRFYNNPLLP